MGPEAFVGAEERIILFPPKTGGGMETTHHISSRLATVAALIGAAVLVVPSTAMADGTVVVSNATEFVTAFQDPTTDRIELAADITLAGPAVRPNGADPLEIDGFGFTLSTSADARILETFGSTGALTIENITITGSNPPFGQGGAVRWLGGDVTVRDATFVHNNAVSQGAAILMDGGNLVVERSTFDDTNTGAIFGPATATISDSTFTNNRGSGAVAAGEMTVTRSTFTGNQGIVGGALLANDLTMTDSTVSGNTAVTTGGGIAVQEELILVNSTVSGNESGDRGGGIYNIGTSSRIVNSTITGNTSPTSGGGLFVVGDTTIVYSTIVGNSAPDGANISTFDGEATFEVYGSVVGLPEGGDENCTNVGDDTSAGYAYEAGGNSCGFGGGAGDVTDGPDPLLGPLGDNGGPTQTRLPLAGSPLIDAIPTSACESGPAAGITTDQRGVTRPSAEGCDIGSVEVTADDPSTQPQGPGSTPATGTTGVTPRFTG